MNLFGEKEGQDNQRSTRKYYADGCLRLFKIDLFFEAFKVIWIRRIAATNVDEKRKFVVFQNNWAHYKGSCEGIKFYL